MEAIDDILEWSTTKLSAWRQDALRRLAYTASLTPEDESEILQIIKKQCSFNVEKTTPDPVPLTLAHFMSVPAGPTLQIKCIRNVRGVNRLKPMAEISFCSQGLTIIYGRNGSGKSGFVRIFRSACRTRIENPAKLKVLGNVYRSSSGPQDAEIVINLGQQEVVVPWKAGEPAPDLLLRVCVFDSAAAQFYIDNGNHIHYLPFGLALPHRLNELCINLKRKVDLEYQDIKAKLAIARINFDESRQTRAQMFYNQLSGNVADDQIESECVFSDEDEIRLQELTRLLASAADPTALEALLTWASSLLSECTRLESKFAESELAKYVSIKREAIAARTAASASAADLFSDQPLPGVGSDTWRRLWLVARDYSVNEAYPGRAFPVVSDVNDGGVCIFCQQPLSSEASTRLRHFAEFVSGSLAEAANQAEDVVARAIDELPVTSVLGSAEWPARLEQIRSRDEQLARAVESFRHDVALRRRWASSVLNGDLSQSELPPFASPVSLLQEFVEKMRSEVEIIILADKQSGKIRLLFEQMELIDRKTLSTNQEILVARRDLLQQDSCYDNVLRELHTRGITQKANELIDKHLTNAVIARFDDERRSLQISHLEVGLTRRSDQTKAAFQTDP